MLCGRQSENGVSVWGLQEAAAAAEEEDGDKEEKEEAGGELRVRGRGEGEREGDGSRGHAVGRHDVAVAVCVDLGEGYAARRAVRRRELLEDGRYRFTGTAPGGYM
jgi:hypothetical protein